MCGRFDNHLPKMHGWAEILGDWPEQLDVKQSYNVAPSQDIAVVVSEYNQLHWKSMRWGLVPAWAKDFDSKYATFNARIETLEEKASFKQAWRDGRRCLIPFAGYYEWQGPKGEKQPFYITDPNLGCMVAAGLFEPWQDHYSCTMLTRPADDSLQTIHARMPVLLTPETAPVWMGRDKLNAVELMTFPSPDYVYWPVSKQVGNVRNDSAALIDAIDKS